MPERRTFQPPWVTAWACLLVLLVVVDCGDARGQEKPAGSEESALEPGIPSIDTVINIFDESLPGLQQKYLVPAVTVAVIDEGKIAWSKGYGKLSTNDSRPATADSVMEACSMSKPVFAYIVLRMAETGAIDLDRPLVEYLGHDYLADDVAHRRITARMALGHTSGLPNWRLNDAPNNLSRWKDRVGGELLLGGPLALEFAPGERQSYSGEGYLMLQRAVEKITGAPLEDFAKRDLIEPLGLQNTNYVWLDRFTDIAAKGHDATGKPTAKQPFVQSNAAASLYCSATDYARFLIEFMKPDRSRPHALSEAGVRKMLTPAAAAIEGETVYGLGWGVSMVGGQLMAGHAGNNVDFRCQSLFWPNAQDGLVIMTNAAGGTDLMNAVLGEIEKAFAPPEAAQSGSTSP